MGCPDFPLTAQVYDFPTKFTRIFTQVVYYIGYRLYTSPKRSFRVFTTPFDAYLKPLENNRDKQELGAKTFIAREPRLIWGYQVAQRDAYIHTRSRTSKVLSKTLQKPSLGTMAR
jgi:hypothetical protein